MSDWKTAIEENRFLNVTSMNTDMISTQAFKESVLNSDLVILHHSTNADVVSLSLDQIDCLANSSVTKVIFMGNEVNLPIVSMSSKIDLIRKIGANFVASQLLQEAAEWLYRDVDAKALSIPHGLAQKRYCSTKLPEERSMDIFLRTAKYSGYLGDDERILISRFFAEQGAQLGLECDIRIGSDRLDGNEWAERLGDSRATVATEAGSYYLDSDDSILKKVEEYLRNKNPTDFVLDFRTDKRRFRKWFNWIPVSMKERIYSAIIRSDSVISVSDLLENVEFSELDLLFNGIERSPVYTKAVSSRHFEAIGTKTIQIMFSGRFNDVLQAGLHYLELKRDFSNVDSVVDFLTDNDACRQFADRAYDYCIESHTLQNRVDDLLLKIGVH